MKYSENILGTIGNTPLVKLNKITAAIPALVLAKVETFNPGNSVKDRMAVKMIADAEADGRLRTFQGRHRLQRARRVGHAGSVETLPANPRRGRHADV